MGVLIGIGFAAVCLQFAVSPALLAAARILPLGGRSCGVLPRAFIPNTFQLARPKLFLGKAQPHAINDEVDIF